MYFLYFYYSVTDKYLFEESIPYALFLVTTPSPSAYPANTAAFSPNAVNYQNYAMTEPFAANVPFDFTPAAWMQMMNNMMNIMQMNQMMHQMAAMPMQMMNPAWMNSRGLSPSYNPSPVQPMDPAEYKKWYEQQLEVMKMDK